MITQFFKVCENKKINCFVAVQGWIGKVRQLFFAFPKRFSVLFILFLITSFSFAEVSPKFQQGATIKTLVIDPGHGGQDPGAIGPLGHYEARLALAISLKFGELVEKYFPNVKVIYTRKTDTFVSLKDRADLANKVKADLFFCIHLNSSKSHDAYGTSTYALGLHRADDNLEIAKEAQEAARRENAVIELEEGGLSNYDFDPNSPEGHIIMSMKQNAFLDQSLKIAAAIENQQANFAHRKSRGVKQAGFWVLYRTAMPSILTEIGFVSNPTEEKFLASEEGQKTVAASLFKAFVNYKNDIEGKNNVIDLSGYLKEADDKTSANSATINAIKNEQNSEKNVVEVDTPKEVKTIAKPTPELADSMMQNSSEITTYIPTTTKEEVSSKDTIVANKQIEPKKENAVNLPSKTGQIIYHIQIGAGTAAPNNSAEIQAKFGTIYTENLPKNVMRYMIGNFTNSTDVYKELLRVRASGFPDAFVVRYQDGMRK